MEEGFFDLIVNLIYNGKRCMYWNPNNTEMWNIDRLAKKG
jgi:hypothetical protein